jgi:hypothetical protein
MFLVIVLMHHLIVDLIIDLLFQYLADIGKYLNGKAIKKIA